MVNAASIAARVGLVSVVSVCSTIVGAACKLSEIQLRTGRVSFLAHADGARKSHLCPDQFTSFYAYLRLPWQNLPRKRASPNLRRTNDSYTTRGGV